MKRSKSGGAGVTLSLLVLAFSCLLSALSLVTWRQTRAFEALADFDRLEKSLSLAESERTEFRRQIQGLGSRPRITTFAEERLGMHVPGASEMVLLSGGAR